MNTSIHTLLVRLAASLMAVSVTQVALPVIGADKIVDNPEKLTYEPLNYQPPQPAAYRTTLKSGAVAYIIENRELPTFDLTVLIHTGAMYEPLGKAGLADFTGYLMRNGGVQGMSDKKIDERLAFLAGEISVQIDATTGKATLFCLSKDIDEGLSLLTRILRFPAFDQAALERYRTDALSDMKQRNASSRDIETREWQFLLYGNHPSTNPLRATEQSVNSITREDMIAFHNKYFFPKNFIFAVSGDFKKGDIVAKLDKMMAGWQNQTLNLPAISEQIPDARPGVYMIKKEDVNQSRVRIGHLGVTRDIPDQYALTVMNDILGGGGFSSRIVRRVRSDEGLAYSAGSAFDRPVSYPGTFRAYFQTKHETAAFGTKLVVDEINRIRTEKCDSQTVEDAKSGIIADLVNPFASNKVIVNTFAGDDYTGRPDNYWQDYTKNMQAVDPDAVLAAAKKYLHPEKLVFLIVGDPDAVVAGSDKHPDKVSDFGPITILPLRDPMTLEVK